MGSPQTAGRLAIALTMFAGAAKTQGTHPTPLLAPTGEYKVGRALFDWTDTSRKETEAFSGQREIVVWVWYPASPKPDAEPAEWMPGKWGDVFWTIYVTDHPDVARDGREAITSIRTHAYTDPPVASAKQLFPTLLFAPGQGSTPMDYSSLIEDIVSHGYIVAGIVPTYFARVSVFSDGRVVEGLDVRQIQAGPGGRGPRPYTTEHAIQRMKEVSGIWSEDLHFTLNQLEKVNADAHSPLKGRFDFTRIGAIGHSAGGEAIVHMGQDDARVRAVFDIDGSPSWSAPTRAFGKPLLVLSAASTPVGYDAVLGGAKPGIHLRLAGSTHPFAKDFLLVPFMAQHADNSNRGRPDAVATIDPKRAVMITQAYAEAFFDHYLNGKPAAILDGPSPAYPEITFEQGSGRGSSRQGGPR